MSLRGLKDRFLALPWVYDTLRPLAVGGLDLGVLGAFCALEGRERVFDLGCGTAQILSHLRFERYLGVDLDARALAKAAWRASPAVAFLEGDRWDGACSQLHPDVALMFGVVHHLADDEFIGLIGRLRAAAPELERLVTTDVTFLPGAPFNNLLSRLDRGRHVRRPAEYERLFRRAGLEVARKAELPTRLRWVRYACYHLHPGARG